MTETSPISSNPSLHRPADILIIAWAASRTRAARLPLRAKTALSRKVYHTAVHSLEFMMSNSNEENVNDRCRVCAVVFVNKKRKRIIDSDFLKKL